MSKRLRNLKIQEVSLVDKGANQHAHVTLFKRDTSMPDDPKLKELEKQLADAKAAAEAATKELAELKGSGTLSTDLDVTKKALADKEKALAEATADLRKQLDDRSKEVEAARAEITKVRAQRRRDEFIKRAGELTNLPGAPADDFAELLDNVDQGLRLAAPDKAEKYFAKLNMLLSSWNEIIKQSAVFQNFGRTGTESMMRGAEAVLHAMAKERATADKTDFAQAYAKVLKENPDIYARYRAEKEA